MSEFSMLKSAFFSPFSLELTPLHCILEDIAVICTLAGRQGLIGTWTEYNC